LVFLAKSSAFKYGKALSAELNITRELQDIRRPASENRAALWVALAATLLHVFLIGLPGINLEWVFADGGKYLRHIIQIFSNATFY